MVMRQIMRNNKIFSAANGHIFNAMMLIAVRADIYWCHPGTGKVRQDVQRVGLLG